MKCIYYAICVVHYLFCITCCVVVIFNLKKLIKSRFRIYKLKNLINLLLGGIKVRLNPKTKIHGLYIFDPKKVMGYQSYVKSDLSQEATRMGSVKCFDLIYH